MVKCVPINNVNLSEQARVLYMAHSLRGILVNEQDVHLSWFPLSRPYERIIVTLYLSIGASVAFTHPDSRFFTDAGEPFLN